jgi:hypothetical protein
LIVSVEPGEEGVFFLSKAQCVNLLCQSWSGQFCLSKSYKALIVATAL